MQPGALIADRFEIERSVRAGGMSTVYRAIDGKTREPVAIKLLSPKYAHESERFIREAIALESLQHPSIVRYVAHGVVRDGDGDTHYLAMEWLEGEDLAGRLERSSLTIAESIALSARMASALAVAHARGLVHRDIKPSNIFLPDGDPERVKLIDFGIVRFADRAELTGPGVIFGTPGYMAPEQARGERRIDARVDIYALGCVLFECITGRPVFTGAHPTAILAKVVLEDAPRLRSIKRDAPEAIDRLLARMLSKVVSSRPGDARALAAEIEELGTRISFDDAEAASGAISARIDALTENEQRLVAMVMTGPTSAPPTDATLAIGDVGAGASTLDAVRTAVSPFGARLEGLRNGSLVAVLLGAGNAPDQAAHAARCALAMRAQLPDVEIVLGMGRAVIGDRIPVGEVIDHAVDMLRAAAEVETLGVGLGDKPVHVDAMTAALLDARFDVVRRTTAVASTPIPMMRRTSAPLSLSAAVTGSRNFTPAAAFLLHGEREPVEATRTLLGRPTPCVGRDRELSLLQMVLQESMNEPVARGVLVTGPAGMGKSRIRHEFLRTVRTSGKAEVWIGRGDPMSAGSPFGMIAQVVRAAMGMREGEPLGVKQQKLRARVGQRVTAKRSLRTTQFLGELVGARFPDEDSVHLRAARQDAMLMGDQMRAAWEDFLDSESSAKPVVLVLEDLHWGDLPSVQFIDAALRNLRDRPIFVFALARPEVHELFPKLWAGRGVQEIRLGELTRKWSEKLVREVLADRATDEVVARLVERAAGNAFYLEELIRAVAEGGGDELPDTVVAMVQARLERLEPDARRLLRAASVFGSAFWRNGVRSLIGGSASTKQMDEWLAELVSRETITRRAQGKFPGEEEYVFHHGMVREAAYAMLTQEDQRVGHRLAGGWLEQVGESDAMVLAEHLERGGEHQRAVHWYRRAAEHALEGNDFDQVIERAERGVVCGAEGEVLGGMRMLQAEAHRWRGDLAGSEACSLDAMRLLPRCSAGWFSAVGDLVLASGRRGKPDQLATLGKMLCDLGAMRPVTGPHAISSARAATQLLLVGKADLADRLIDMIGKLPREVEQASPAVTARICVARAYRALCHGDTGSAVEFHNDAAERFERVGDLRNACVQRGERASAETELGAYAEATATLREVLTDSERLGRLHYANAAAKLNLGTTLAQQGALEEARAIETEAVEEFATRGDRRMEGGARIVLAEILLLSGDYEGAARQAKTSYELLSAAPPMRAWALAVSALVALASGRHENALRDAEQAYDLLQQLGSLEVGESLVRLAHAEALYRAGRHETARQAIGAARSRLRERAEKIRDAKLRQSFLTNVHENARTMALAAEWIDGARSA